MEFTCCNCGTKFLQKIEFGKSVHSVCATCPFCGAVDHGDFYTKRQNTVKFTMDNFWDIPEKYKLIGR